jgi:hypothetical protein
VPSPPHYRGRRRRRYGPVRARTLVGRRRSAPPSAPRARWRRVGKHHPSISCAGASGVTEQLETVTREHCTVSRSTRAFHVVTCCLQPAATPDRGLAGAVARHETPPCVRLVTRRSRFQHLPPPPSTGVFAPSCVCSVRKAAKARAARALGLRGRGCGPGEGCVGMHCACLRCCPDQSVSGFVWGDLHFGGDDDGKVEGNGGDSDAVRAWIPSRLRAVADKREIFGGIGSPAVLGRLRCRIRLPSFVERVEGGGRWDRPTS